jgi:hypothetical protein
MTAPNPPYSDCPQCRAEDEAIGRLVTAMGEVIHGADPYLAARATFCVMSGCLLVMHAGSPRRLSPSFLRR